MTKPNTDYGLRIPGSGEIREAFGSLHRAAEVTGGDLPTILFYLANPGRIPGAPCVSPHPGQFAKDFRKTANVERETADVEFAADLYEQLEKPTIAAVSRGMGVCRSVARRLLVTAGKLAS